jgi:hypothetical protein
VDISYNSYSESVSLPFLAIADKGEDVGVVEGVQNFMSFVGEVKDDGVYHAIYGKSFGQVTGDFFKELGHDIGVFTLNSGDFLFLMPAILFMFMTFMVGKNRFTKWIIPLWFAYFVSRAFYYMILQGGN